MPHPKYDDMTTDNDFNLVFLSRPVSAKNLKLVTLNTEDDMPAVGDSVHVPGWGDTAREDDILTLSNALMVSAGSFQAALRSLRCLTSSLLFAILVCGT